MISKSPLTGFAAAAQANGFFGARLKAAGYDAVVVEGCSPNPVYLHIRRDNVELQPADFLKNKGVFETIFHQRRRIADASILASQRR